MTRSQLLRDPVSGKENIETIVLTLMVLISELNNELLII